MDNTIQLLDISNSESASDRRDLGAKGEELAASHLKRNGYRIVMANFKVPIGRSRNESAVTGEIDLIALDGETLCFVEVKTRTSEEFASPLSAIDLRKQRQIVRTAKVYKRIFNIRNLKVRYDAVTVVAKPNERPAVTLIKGYWNEEKFRKRKWTSEFQQL
jgi:putative endonuclease